MRDGFDFSTDGVAVIDGTGAASGYVATGVSDEPRAYERCASCGGLHGLFEGTVDTTFLNALNADERGEQGPNAKPSLTPAEAGAQITRNNLSWSPFIGEGTNVTFAFRSTEPLTPAEDAGGFTRFTELQIATTLQVLAGWSDVANITFQRVSDADGYSNAATILFANYTTGVEGAAAFAFLPGSRSSASASGDVWINSSIGYNNTLIPLGYGRHVLAHEIGHAIGLSHPAAYDAEKDVTITYGADATYYEDSRQYSLMSYFSETNTGGNFNRQYASSPLMDDISAAQRLYGANLTTRTGDTVYGFNATADRAWFAATSAAQPLIFAVWDAGGSDTLDFSGYGQSQLIDLAQGAFSNVGGLIGNVSIAVGAVIEHAIGGSGADVIRGNAQANRLSGGAGNDTLRGDAGNDTIDGGAGIDTVVFGLSAANYTMQSTATGFSVVGNASTVVLTNVERIQFASEAAVDINTASTARFDALTYIASNPDLILAFGTDTVRATAHYLEYRSTEPRSIDSFNGLVYSASHSDLTRAFGADSVAATIHYIQYGYLEGRATASFDALTYAASSRDLATVFGTDISGSARHYLTFGVFEGRPVSGFDALGYVASHADLARAIGSNANLGLRHYLDYGADEGRATAGFDPLIYVASHADLTRILGLNASAARDHYLASGADEGRSANAFDPRQYAASSVDLAKVFGSGVEAATAHYIQQGFYEGRATSGFDAVAYLLTYPDLAGLTPTQALNHWLGLGADEGRIGDVAYGRDQISHVLTGTDTSSRLGYAGDRDWFEVRASAGQTVTINLVGQGGGGGAGSVANGTLAVHDGVGRLFAYDDNSGPGADAALVFVAPVTGTYFVAVNSGVGGVGTYRLNVTYSPQSSAEEEAGQAVAAVLSAMTDDPSRTAYTVWDGGVPGEPIIPDVLRVDDIQDDNRFYGV